MRGVDKLAGVLVKTVKKPDNKPKPTGYDTSAEVKRVEGDTVYVHIPGGVDETPVKRTVDAKPGDNVQVRVANGRAFIVGNATSPPTDDSTANYVNERVTDLKNSYIENSNIVNAEIVNLKARDSELDQAIVIQSNIVKSEIYNSQIEDFTVINGVVQGLKATDAEISGKITAAEADIGNLKANKADISELEANYAHISNGVIDNAKIGYADVNDLNAHYAHISNGVIDNAKIGYADVNDLNAHYANIDLANVNNAWIQNGVIKDAAISDAQIIGVGANKITAGVIDASKITVTNLNADNITAGTINGQRIGIGSLSLDKLSEEVPTKEYLDDLADNLQGQIDGQIETWTGTTVPTLNNAPAVDWKGDAKKLKAHVGDIYYVVNASNDADGYTYRFTESGSGSSATYSWTLIKDNQITKALQEIQEAKGDISGIKQFDSEVSSWKTDTDEELSSLKGRTTTLETDMGTKVSTQTFNELSQTVDENTASISTLSETVDTKADGSTVTELSNTVNTVKQTADSNKSSITNLTKKVDDNETDIEQKYSDLTQDLSGFKTTVGSTYHKISDFNTYKTANDAAVAAAKKAGDDAQDDLDAYKGTVDETYATKSSVTQTANSIRQDVESSYTKTTTFNNYKSSNDAAVAAAKKAGTDAQTNLNSYKETNDEAVAGAVSDASTAKSDAATAKSDASTAKTNASTALTTANTAKTDAATAKSDASTAKSDASTAKTNAASAVSTANAANQTAGEAKTAAQAAQDDLDEFKGTVEETYATKSALTQTESSIKQEVSSTYTTQTTFSNYKSSNDTAVADAKKAGTDAQSNLNAYKTTNDAAVQAAKSTADAAKDAIDNLEIGGRNLATKTGVSQKLTTQANQNWFVPDDFFKLSDYGSALLADENNQYFTISYDYVAEDVATAFILTTALMSKLNTYTPPASSEIVHGSYPTIAVGDSSGHASFTFMANSGQRTYGPQHGFMFSGSGNGNADVKLTISNFKFELGNQATDWAPAPEDLEAATAAVASDLASVKTTYVKNSTFETTTEQIRGEVSAVETTTKSYTDGKISQEVTDRNSAINQKADAITASVSSTYATKDSLESAKSEIKVTTDGISTEVAKKTDKASIISTIRQSAESVKIKASQVEIDGTATFNAIKDKADAAYDAKGAASDAVGDLVDDLESASGTTVINGGHIETNSIGANKIKVSELTIGQSQVNGLSTALDGKQPTGDYATNTALNNEVNARKASYATSSTDAGTQAKVASCSNFALYTGATVTVGFTKANTHATPTLNVNSTGAKTIRNYTGAALTAAEYKWVAGAALTFVYDGTYWRMQDSGATESKAAAAASASTASSKASEAATSASNASSSASTASTKASEAATSASTASTKASEASTSASTASSKATAAANSATTASTKASEASTSASTASSKATAAANSATAAENAKNVALDTITVKDTRNDNQPPSWYISNYPRKRVQEFKFTTKIGLSGDTYCWLQTDVPWGDSSGGYPKQTTEVNGKFYTRQGTNASTWSEWKDLAGIAENYIHAGSDGIKIANADPEHADTYQKQTSNATEFYVDGIKKSEVSGEGLKVYDGSETPYASFGFETSIGLEDGYNTNIKSDSFSIKDGSIAIFDISPSESPSAESYQISTSPSVPVFPDNTVTINLDKDPVSGKVIKMNILFRRQGVVGSKNYFFGAGSSETISKSVSFGECTIEYTAPKTFKVSYAGSNDSYITVGETTYIAAASDPVDFGAFSFGTKRYSAPWGNNSATLGHGLNASFDFQTVVGKYNAMRNGPFIVGNGDLSTSSNALAVGWNGDLKLNGDVYVNCNADSTGGTNIRDWATPVLISYQNPNPNVISHVAGSAHATPLANGEYMVWFAFGFKTTQKRTNIAGFRIMVNGLPLAARNPYFLPCTVGGAFRYCYCATDTGWWIVPGDWNVNTEFRISGSLLMYRV